MPVFKRGSVWCYAFCIRGIRYRRSVPEARTKWQAEQAEAKAKNDVYEGRFGSEPSNITLKEFVKKQYLLWAKENKRSWRNDESRSKPILAYFKNKQMREITRFNVEQFKRERMGSFNKRGEVRAPASVNRELQLLSRIFSLAIERELIHTNPCKGVKLCRVGNIVTRYLTTEEEKRLLASLTGRRAYIRDVVAIDLHTGMRLREILGLHKSQVDFIRNVIELLETKSGKPRTIPIHPDIKPTLQRLCEQAGENGYLFESEQTGKPIHDIKTAWRNALDDAEITNLRFHDLRHTFGTRAADGGAHVKDIQAVMGHADVRTTMRYVHATDEGRRRVVEAAAKGGRESATNLPQKRKATS